MSRNDAAKAMEELHKQLESAKLLKDLSDSSGMSKKEIKKQLEDLQRLSEPIDRLLKQLGNRSLNRTHTSVLISFTQMLNYMNRIIKPVKQPDILCLLTTFRDMALRYYTQFERSLLEELEKQDKLIKNADQVIQQIDDALIVVTDDAAWHTGRKLVTESRDSARKELESLTRAYPTLLQESLNKLKSEWQRLNTIAVASKEITKNEKLLQTLDLVVEAARFSVGIDVSRIAVVPGEAFSLQFYAYLKNFAVLTVPIHSVQAPWEWSIFWHELAGEKVRRLEQNTAFEIESIRKNLRLIRDKWSRGDDDYKQRLLEFVTRNNQYTDHAYQDSVGLWKNNFSRDVLRDFFSNSRPNWRDLGGFEHQFEQMLEKLLSKDKFNQYDQIKASGWCVDWFKELFEDAWSVLAIRDPFKDFLQDVLERHVAEDDRHPPIMVRVKVAEKILELMKSDEPSWNKHPRDIIEAAAQQILRFISLLIAPPMQRVFEMPYTIDDPNYWSTLRPQLADFVGSLIGKYIQKWSSGLSGDIPLTETMSETSKNAEDFNNELSEVADFKKSLATFSQQPADEIQPNIDGLLLDEKGSPKGYKKLLELSFYDVDFLVGENPTYRFTHITGTYTITLEHLNTAIKNFWIKIQDPNDTNWAKITLFKPDNSLLADYWTTTIHISGALQTVGNSLITKV